jgi:hypothetical protein
MRRLSAKGILRLSVVSAIASAALWLFVSLPDLVHGGEQRFMALLFASAGGVLAFAGMQALGFLFLYKRSDLT